MESTRHKQAALITRVQAGLGLALSLLLILIALGARKAAEEEEVLTKAEGIRARPALLLIVALVLAALHIANLVFAGRVKNGDPSTKKAVIAVSIAVMIVGLFGGFLSWVVNIIGAIIVLVFVIKAYSSPSTTPSGPPVVS